MLHARIIRELGGPAELARRLGYEHSSVVSRWASRGIPPHLWRRMVALCAEDKVRVDKRRLTWQDLADSSPLINWRRAA